MRKEAKIFKILVITSTYPSDKSAPFVLKQMQALRKADPSIEFTILTPKPIASNTLLYKDINTLYYATMAPRCLNLSQIGIPEAMAKKSIAIIGIPYFLFSQFFGLIRTLGTKKYDVILIHWLLPQGILTGIAASLTNKNRKTKRIVIAHGSDIRIIKRLKKIGKLFIAIIGISSQIISPSKYLQRELIKIYPKVNARFIPLGFSDNIFKSDGAKYQNLKNLTFVGRTSKEKGFLLLIEAMSQVIKEDKEFRLNIIGDSLGIGSAHQDLSFKESNLQFHGALNEKQISEILANTGIFISPSIIEEGLSIATLEAMGMGLPIISTGLGGLGDLVIPSVNGWIVKDARELAQTLVNLDTLNERDYLRLSKQSIELSREYRGSENISQWLTLFKPSFQALQQKNT